MAKFDIPRTTRLPPAVGPNIRANLDLRTGGVAAGQALAQAGGQLANLGISIIQKRQQMTDARATVFANAALQSAKQKHGAFREVTADTRQWEPDVEQRRKDVLGALESIPMSDDRRALISAQIGADFDVLRASTFAAATRREVEDSITAVSGDFVAAIASGDPIRMKTSRANLEATFTGLFDEAEKRQRIAVLEEAGLKKQQDLIAEVTFNTARGQLFADGVKTINAANLPEKRKASMVTALRQDQKFRAQEMVKDLTAQLHTIQTSDVSPEEKRGQYANIAEQIKTVPGITPAELRTSLDRITLLQSGSDVKTDFPTWRQVMTRLRAINSSSSAEQIDDAQEFLTLSTDKLSVPDAKAAQNYLANLLDDDKAQAIQTSVDLAIQGGQITEDFDEANYTVQLQEWANANQDKTASEIREKGAEIAADFKKTPPQIFTPARVQRTLGELTVKSWVDINGRARQLRRGKDAIAHVTKTLGPNWQVVAPDAAGIIEKNWPDAIVPKIDVIPAPPPGVPADAKWDSNRQMWTWIRDGRLKGFSGGGQ